MLISFTQTYGNERTELYEINSRDCRLIEFKNLFNINIHAFHNCSDNVISVYKKNNKVKNSIYFEFYYEHYGDCVKDILQYLKNVNCTHFLFIQDDVFSVNNGNVNLLELFNYIKQHDDEFMLSLYYNIDFIDRRLKPDNIFKTFDIYHLKSFDFKELNYGAMDDSPFVCTSDLLYRIYDDKYLSHKNIWSMEKHLNNTHSFKSNINRYVTDNTLFKSYNLYGKNISEEKFHRAKLKIKSLL